MQLDLAQLAYLHVAALHDTVTLSCCPVLISYQPIAIDKPFTDFFKKYGILATAFFGGGCGFTDFVSLRQM
jgi:hypothetical protein